MLVRGVLRSATAPDRITGTTSGRAGQAIPGAARAQIAASCQVGGQVLPSLHVV